jgi:hypothetical protein
MFLDNKYTKWYNAIIVRANTRTLEAGIYFETHHIIPKCLGGSECKANLVALTPKEHFICHLLLYRMVDDKVMRGKLLYAALCMCRTKNKGQGERISRINSGIYAFIKAETSKLTSQAFKGRAPWNKGLPASETRRTALREFYNTELGQQRRVIISGQQKQRAKIKTNFKGEKHSDETRRKMRETKATTRAHRLANPKRASPVEYNGTSYPSISEAFRQTGVARRLLRKLAGNKKKGA